MAPPPYAPTNISEPHLKVALVGVRLVAREVEVGRHQVQNLAEVLIVLPQLLGQVRLRAGLTSHGPSPRNPPAAQGSTVRRGEKPHGGSEDDQGTIS
jgi:hypothetical protein